MSATDGSASGPGVLSVAVLGSGFMGGVHARAFARLPGVRVTGVSSRSHERAAALADEVGARPFTDAGSLIALDEVDAVSVTLPTHLHEAYAVAALEAGKHVLVEKPMALTLDACDAMIAAARASGRTLMVAHVLRFWPEYVALVERVHSGRLGRPLSASALRLSSRPAWGEWFANPAWTGGAVHDLHIHDLDGLAWLFGRAPLTVHAYGRRGPTGGWDHLQTLLDYGEASALAEGSVMMPDDYPFAMSLRVHCERGSIEFAFRAGGSGVETGSAAGSVLSEFVPGREPRRIETTGEDAFESEIAYFARCVRSASAPTRADAVAGRQAVRVALAVRRSLDIGRAVSLDDEPPA